jgi:hypothetical protein
LNSHTLSLAFSIYLYIESDESPGIYLRDDFLGGPTELRAPTAERAALFLDAALAGRTSSIYEPALIFTLHVYQYSLGAGKGGGELMKIFIDNDCLRNNCLYRGRGKCLHSIQIYLIICFSFLQNKVNFPPSISHLLS